MLYLQLCIYLYLRGKYWCPCLFWGWILLHSPLWIHKPQIRLCCLRIRSPLPLDHWHHPPLAIYMLCQWNAVTKSTTRSLFRVTMKVMSFASLFSSVSDRMCEDQFITNFCDAFWGGCWPIRLGMIPFPLQMFIFGDLSFLACVMLSLLHMCDQLAHPSHLLAWLHRQQALKNEGIVSSVLAIVSE